MNEEFAKVMGDVLDQFSNYFNRAGTSREENIRLFKEYVPLLKNNIMTVSAGLGALVYKLTTFPDKDFDKRLLRQYENRMIELCRIMGRQWLTSLEHIVSTFGERGHIELISLLSIVGEYERSLDCCLLSLPEYTNDLTQKALQKAWKTANGTGSRLAIAYALMHHGDFEPISGLARTFLVDPGGWDRAYGIARTKNPSIDSRNLEKETYKLLAEDGLVDLVLLDIATEGKLPHDKFPNWISAN